MLDAWSAVGPPRLLPAQVATPTHDTANGHPNGPNSVPNAMEGAWSLRHQGTPNAAVPQLGQPNGGRAEAMQVWPGPTAYKAEDGTAQQLPGQTAELAIAGRARKQLAWERRDHTLPTRAQPACTPSIASLTDLYTQAGADPMFSLPAQATLQQEHLPLGGSEGSSAALSQLRCSSTASGQTAVSWRELQASAAQGQQRTYAPEHYARDAQPANHSFQQPYTAGAGRMAQQGVPESSAAAMLLHSSAMMLAVSNAMACAPVQMHNGQAFHGAAASSVDLMHLMSYYDHLKRTMQVRLQLLIRRLLCSPSHSPCSATCFNGAQRQFSARQSSNVLSYAHVFLCCSD